MEKGPCHDALKPLLWLMGKWKSISAEGSYPNINPFKYCEEITFESIGQPMLNYTSHTWHPVKLTPMHLESGFLRIKLGTNQIAFMVSHNFGLTSLEEGSVCGNSLNCKTTQINRMSFAKEPAVTCIERQMKINEEGNLEITVFMATSKTPLTQHLKAVYHKI